MEETKKQRMIQTVRELQIQKAEIDRLDDQLLAIIPELEQALRGFGAAATPLHIDGSTLAYQKDRDEWHLVVWTHRKDKSFCTRLTSAARHTRLEAFQVLPQLFQKLVDARSVDAATRRRVLRAIQAALVVLLEDRD